MATAKSDSKRGEKAGTDSVTELMVDSFDMSVRTCVTLVKIPLVMCNSIASSWFRAVETVLDDIKSDG